MKKLFLLPLFIWLPLTFGGELIHSSAYEASHVLATGPRTLVSCIGYNSGSAQFIQLHDATSLPANGAVPTYTFTVPASSNFSLDIPNAEAKFGVGIVVCNSSTGPTLTIGSANCFFTAVTTK